MHSVPSPDRESSTVGPLLLAAAACWALAVAWSAGSGVLASLVGPRFALLVVAGIATPTLFYFVVPGVRARVAAAGLRRITQLHVWRIAAALAFFWYGAQGLLPPLFWIPAGVGDLLVGLVALRFLGRTRPERSTYRTFHIGGFVDFVIAVGSGLVHTLNGDPRMAPLATLPLALIPLFGVGISGASHLVAFHLLHKPVARPEDATIESIGEPFGGTRI